MFKKGVVLSEADIQEIMERGLRGFFGETPPEITVFDCNQDAKLDLADPVCLLGFLFGSAVEALPCGDGSEDDSGNVVLFDWNGDGSVDIADAVASLNWMFIGGAPHELDTIGDGTTCVGIIGCPAVCEL